MEPVHGGRRCVHVGGERVVARTECALAGLGVGERFELGAEEARGITTRQCDDDAAAAVHLDTGIWPSLAVYPCANNAHMAGQARSWRRALRSKGILHSLVKLGR